MFYNKFHGKSNRFRTVVKLISLNNYNVQYLQKLQNKGMKIILRCNYRTRIEDMLKALQFMSIKERIKYNVCILIHKMVNGDCPVI